MGKKIRIGQGIIKKVVIAFLIVLMATNLLVAMSRGSQVVKMHEEINEQVLGIMERAADWQINNHLHSRFHDLDWTNATFYIGLMELSKISRDSKYHQWLIDLGRKYHWQPFFNMYLADDIAVSQIYLDMYKLEGDKQMFNPTYARTEWIINHPSISNLLYDASNDLTLERWSWCDALFMAPPVYAQMYNITNDVRFLEFMDREFRMTYDLLYDKKENLFYRDHNYFDKRENNGEKVFWGRGNGWVIGGLVKILKELPETSQCRLFYEKLFTEMCEKASVLQDEEGYWHASMLDRKAYPNPETSCSGFFVYALAYGINSGLLDKDKYLPVVIKGWQALEKSISPDGKLGWVQPVGASPQGTTKEMTEVYGVGSFLLAGSEIYKLAE